MTATAVVRGVKNVEVCWFPDRMPAVRSRRLSGRLSKGPGQEGLTLDFQRPPGGPCLGSEGPTFPQRSAPDDRESDVLEPTADLGEMVSNGADLQAPGRRDEGGRVAEDSVPFRSRAKLDQGRFAFGPYTEQRAVGAHADEHLAVHDAPRVGPFPVALDGLADVLGGYSVESGNDGSHSLEVSDAAFTKVRDGTVKRETLDGVGHAFDTIRVTPFDRRISRGGASGGSTRPG